MKWMNCIGMAARAALFALALITPTGCGTPPTPQPASSTPSRASAGTPSAVTAGDDLMRVNDLVVVTFTGLTTPLPKHEERIKEDGSITPSTLFPPVVAAGKNSLQLQRELQELYSKFYRNLTVTVAPELRFFFVAGEVRRPDRFTHAGETTVLGAITTAGHFTDFANRRRVQLTRANGQKQVVDCIKALKEKSLDLPVFAGDKIDVPRRSF